MTDKHQKKMQKLKESIDAGIIAADTERGVVILLTGDGKGKTSSAFGMVMRALGYDYKVGVVQFIKGEQLSGEELYLRDKCPQVDFYQMGTGFTWNTQDRDADIAAIRGVAGADIVAVCLDGRAAVNIKEDRVARGVVHGRCSCRWAR